MTKTAIPAAGEAVPAKASDEAVADAMKKLEGDVIAILHLSEISAEAFDRAFFRRHGKRDHDQNIELIISVHELDQMAFLVNLVAEQGAKLRQRFDAAYSGEVVK